MKKDYCWMKKKRWGREREREIERYKERENLRYRLYAFMPSNRIKSWLSSIPARVLTNIFKNWPCMMLVSINLSSDIRKPWYKFLIGQFILGITWYSDGRRHVRLHPVPIKTLQVTKKDNSVSICSHKGKIRVTPLEHSFYKISISHS